MARTWYRTPQDLPGGRRPGGLEATSATSPRATAAPSPTPATPPGRGRPGNRRGRAAGLCHRRGRRHADQPDDRGRPGLRRPGAGDRHRAVRGDARSTPTASRWPRPSPTTCCRVPPKCRRSASTTCRRLAPTRFGQKGIGESGAIGPPAAIANAVNDALKGLGAELLHRPSRRDGCSKPSPRPTHGSRRRRNETGRRSTTPGRATLAAALALLRRRERRRQGDGGQPVARADAEHAARATSDAAWSTCPASPSCGQAREEGRRRRATAPASPTPRSRTAARPTSTAGLRCAGVARDIAYRAVRSRGTIGGSLSPRRPGGGLARRTLAALGASVIAGRAGGRASVAMPVADYMTGARSRGGPARRARLLVVSAACPSRGAARAGAIGRSLPQDRASSPARSGAFLRGSRARRSPAP